MITTNVLDQMYAFGVIPVITIEDAAQTLELGDALHEGGLPCAEITFRSKAAEAAIQSMVEAHPEFLVGAGSVLSVEQAEKAIQAGAKFIITPGFDEEIVEYCIRQNVPIIPGIATPTEINLALKSNLSICKFFPAEALGGVRTLKAISEPYKHVRFLPTGGINADNLKDYLDQPQVLACGGSWMVKEELINESKFNEITLLTKEAVKLVAEVRS